MWSSRRLRVCLVACLMVPLTVTSLWLAPAASALGAKIYHTNSTGQETSPITGVGNTSPSCCCISHGEGAVGLGVKVCYLPVP